MNVRRIFDLVVVFVLVGSMLLTPLATLAQGPAQDNASLTSQIPEDWTLKDKERAARAELEAAASRHTAPVSGNGIAAMILSEDFETWPPPNWNIVNNGGDCVWESTATTGEDNYAGGDGEAADANSDVCGSGTTMDTELRTPALDLTPYGGASLEFIAAYNDIGSGGDTFAVDVSSDGGTTWTNLLRWDEDHSDYGPGELVKLDLTPYTSNNVVIRFHYYGATYDWWAQVDQVRIFSPMPKLSTSYKEVSSDLINPGDLLTYTIVISNSGNLSATNTTLVDPIPAGTQFASLIAPPSASYNSALDQVEWNGTVTAGEEISVTFVVTVSAGITCGAVITNTATISDVDIPAPVVVQARTETFLDQVFFFEDFEADNGGFAADDPPWEWGDVGPYSGSRNSWPEDARSGTKAWATNLTGDYGSSEDGYLTSPTIDLSNAANVPGIPLYLTWWQWMYNESATYDWGEVEIRGGSTDWTLVDPPGRMGGGQDLDWAMYQIDISNFAGVNDFQIRFHFHSDGSVTYPGWYVDDISIQQCEPPPGLYLSPDTLEVRGCVGAAQTHAMHLSNWTGSDGTFSLSYDLTEPGWGTIDGPASLSISDTMGTSFVITITPETCLPDSLQLLASVEASGNGYSETAAITKTVTTKGYWVFDKAMPTPRGDLAVVYGGDGGVYAIGGTVGGGTPNGENERYDIATDTWTTTTSMPTGMTLIDGGQVNGVIYIPGGYDSNGFVATTQAYSTTADSWTTIAAAPRSVAAYAVATCGGKLYRSGGAEEATFPNGTTDLEVYDPATDSWTALASMNHGHTWHAMACINGKLYVAGGIDDAGGESTVAEVYDIATDTWDDAAMADLPVTWWGAADFVKHDKLVLAGGVVEGVASAQVIIYDPATDTWTDGTPLQDTRFRLEGDFGLDSGHAVGGWNPVWSPHGSNEYLLQCPACTNVGWLDGHVYDYDGQAAPCTDATVHIEPGDIDVAVDASGYYTVPLIPFDYEVTADAVDYPETSGPYTVTIGSGVSTTQDFTMTRADIEVTPLAFDVSAISPASVTRTLIISNNGTYSLEWEIREVAPTTIRNAMSSAAKSEEQAGLKSRTTNAEIEVEPQLLAALDANGSSGYLIYFRERPDLSPAFKMDWTERGRFVVNALQETAKASQARVRAYLEAQGVEYQPFWIDNVIVVEKSDRATFNGLLSFPEISALRARRMMHLIEPVSRNDLASVQAIEPNISHVGADQVWGMGFTGQGMVVANIDTGVRYTHEALVDHYRGNLGGGNFDHDYNWLGPADGDTVPTDDHGHGSHTMGTMIGDDGGTNQIGMAPGAKWIACDGCSASSGCPDSALLTCAQWVAAPYPIGNPSSPDPDKRPNVVNNSWGDCSTSYDNWYQGVVDSWHAVGIYPVFANGNASNCGYPEPPGCNTVGNPGRYGNVTGVGSTGQSNGQYATHSNWGPTDNADTVNPRGYPNLKPQVLAPGVNIRSSLNGSDSQYASWGGTSMSTPHVAGLIALMWNAAPCLIGDYAATETLIEETATPIPYNSGCGGEGPGNVPNMATGWGEIDAHAAVEAAMDYCGTDLLDWVSTGIVSGTLVSGTQTVQVTFTCTPTATQQTQPLKGILRINNDDPCDSAVDVDLTFWCASQSPIPNWEKEVRINGQEATPVAGPHTVRPDDTVVIVDRVGATFSETITSTLTETWGDALALVSYDTNGVGTVTQGATSLTWDLTGVAPNTFYPITKTFRVQYGDWTTDLLTETYAVQGATTQPDDIVVTWNRYIPAMTLDKTGPMTATSGETISLTLVISSDGSFRGEAVLTDTLPVSMTYAGNLTTTYGRAWEDADVIHWTNYTTTTALIHTPTAINVGVLSPDSDALQDLVDLLNGMSGVTAERIQGDLGTMTLADLTPYHLIVTSNNNKWGDAGANPNIGNILANYVDGGGKLILANFVWDNVGWGLEGRLLTDGYTPYRTATADLGNASLGNYDNTHPVMKGVTALSVSGTAAHQNLPTESGATWIADWDDSTPCVYAQGTSVIGYNFLLDWTDPGWPWSGDVPVLLENSINWLMAHAAPPMPATVSITFDVQVTGGSGDIIRNTAELVWPADWTSDAHDVAIIDAYRLYLPVVFKGD